MLYPKGKILSGIVVYKIGTLSAKTPIKRLNYLEMSIALVVFAVEIIKKYFFKEVGMKQHYLEPVIEFLEVRHSDVLLISLDTPENRNDIFGGGDL